MWTNEPVEAKPRVAGSDLFQSELHVPRVCEGKQSRFSLTAEQYWSECNKLFKAIDKCSIPLHQFMYIIYRFASSLSSKLHSVPVCRRSRKCEITLGVYRCSPEMVNKLMYLRDFCHFLCCCCWSLCETCNETQGSTMMLYKEHTVNVHSNALSQAGSNKLCVLSLPIHNMLYKAFLLCWEIDVGGWGGGFI